MKVARSIEELRSLRPGLAAPVGFVPTMGYLHDGHLSLIRAAKRGCQSVVASIFVNPTQFAPTEDLTSYPRDLDRDLRMLESEGTDLVFAPADAEEIYPVDFSTWVLPEGITARLEGAARPTHFRGVATVVGILFHLIEPQSAFFGQKDAQQALVIARMIRDLHFDVDLHVEPTVREADGLAMSSRNTYLNAAERAAAPVLRRSLDLAESLWTQGERDTEALRTAMRELLAGEPLVFPEYVSIADPRTLDELDTVGTKALVSLAARLGRTRLIDNTVLPPGTPLIEREAECS
jgi:pantoate--beta-alanine ligase